MDIEHGFTLRGFAYSTFEDLYRAKCSIQKSSAAEYDAIWLGVENPNPQILESQARKYGIEPNKTTGWIEYPIPEEVVITTRMHLNREQVADLLPILQHFVKTGELT